MTKFTDSNWSIRLNGNSCKKVAKKFGCPQADGQAWDRRKGKYGRILGIPYTEDGRDICQVLIKEGHAVEYDGGKKKKVWGDY